MSSASQSARSCALMALLAGLLGAAPCASLADEVYRWVDEQGRIHFSSTPPAKQRVEKWDAGPRERIQVAPDTSATGRHAKPPQPPASASSPEPQVQTRPKRVSGKPRDAAPQEARWRAEAQRLQAEVARLEAELEATEEGEDFYESQYEDGYRIRSENKSRRIDRLKRELEQAQERLDAFEDEARKAGVPPGWLR